MADSKLIFQFKWLNWIFPPLTLLGPLSTLVCRFLLFCFVCFWPFFLSFFSFSFFWSLSADGKCPSSSPLPRKGPSPPHTGSLDPLQSHSRVIALTCHFGKVRPAPHGPLSAFIAAAGLRPARRICDEDTCCVTRLATNQLLPRMNYPYPAGP